MGGVYNIFPTRVVRSVVCTCSFADSTPSPLWRGLLLRKLLTNLSVTKRDDVEVERFNCGEFIERTRLFHSSRFIRYQID